MDVGFPMGDEDRPFSQRMWGLRRQLAPTEAGRRGCMFLLVGGLLVIVVALLIAVIAGTF